MLGSLILYLKGMRITMFQLSGFYCISADFDKVEAGGYATSAVAGVEGAAAVPRF